MLSDQIGYIRPETLNGNKVAQVSAAIKELQGKGAKRLILDLRSCGAGALVSTGDWECLTQA